MEKQYKNTGYFMLLLALVTVVGFYKTYFSQFPDFNENSTAITHSSITIFIHLHAVLVSLWILFLIIQPLLIRSGKLSIHRLIGKTSYFIFPLLTISFVPLIVNILQTEFPILAYIPISDSALLILFYSLAIYNKKNTPLHMRYMIGTAIVFLGPIFGRIGPIIFGLQPNISNNIRYLFSYLILLGLILLDIKHNKKFRPYIVILGALLIQQIIFNILI